MLYAVDLQVVLHVFQVSCQILLCIIIHDFIPANAHHPPVCGRICTHGCVRWGEESVPASVRRCDREDIKDV